VSLADESKISVILLDIEGTTTPVDFVSQTLFPYASRKLEVFLREHMQEPEVRSLLSELRAQHRCDEQQCLQPPAWQEETEETQFKSTVDYLRWLIARDSKCTPLKALQGKIWQEGYARAELRGEVFEDVPRAFTRWRQQRREISIYSSGSVLAQRLLFRTTKFGDLTQYISGFFDTQTGAKNEVASYRKIAVSLGRVPAEVFFLSDAVKEVDAALSAGMRAALCVRNPQSPNAGSFTLIHSFDELFPI